MLICFYYKQESYFAYAFVFSQFEHGQTREHFVDSLTFSFLQSVAGISKIEISASTAISLDQYNKPITFIYLAH